MDRQSKSTFTVLLVINLVIGVFVSLAEGSALLIYRMGKAPEIGPDAGFITVLLCAGLLLMLICIGTFFARGQIRIYAVRVQAAGLSIAAVALVAWIVQLAFEGLPGQGNFSWTFGVAAIFVGYSTYFFCRVFILQYFPSLGLLRHIQWVVGVIVLLIEVLIYMRLRG